MPSSDPTPYPTDTPTPAKTTSTTTNTGAFQPGSVTVAATPKSATAYPQFADGTIDTYSLGDQTYVTAKGAPEHQNVGGGGAHYAASTDMYSSAQAILNGLVSMSQTDKAQFVQWQQEMAAAGHYGTTAPIYGTWTAKDGDALGEALRGYLQVEQSAKLAGTPVAQSFWDWLGTSAQAGVANQTKGVTTQVQLADPTELTRYFNAAVSSSLGRNATPDELNKFISAYHANETVQQQEPAGTPQTAVDPRGQALQAAHTLDPTGFQNHQTTGYMDSFLNMFLPQNSQVAQTPTDTNSITY